MDITKMWTLSTGHITEKTNEYLSESINSTEMNRPIVYEKGEYGYYIPVMDEDDEVEYPEDLQRIIEAARDFDCSLICLDTDGEIVKWLPVYDW